MGGTTKVAPASSLGQEVGKFLGYCCEAGVGIQTHGLLNQALLEAVYHGSKYTCKPSLGRPELCSRASGSWRASTSSR